MLCQDRLSFPEGETSFRIYKKVLYNKACTFISFWEEFWSRDYPLVSFLRYVFTSVVSLYNIQKSKTPKLKFSETHKYASAKFCFQAMFSCHLEEYRPKNVLFSNVIVLVMHLTCASILKLSYLELSNNLNFRSTVDYYFYILILKISFFEHFSCTHCQIVCEKNLF